MKTLAIFLLIGPALAAAGFAYWITDEVDPNPYT